MLEPIRAEITREDFLSSGWETIVANCDHKKCELYFSHFFQEENKAKEAGDTRRASIFRLLGGISSLHPKLDTPEAPYGPLFVMQSGRSAILDDFDETHLTFLSDIVADITAPELQARVADVLCFRKRDYRYAEIAVAAYLKSSEASKVSDHWRDVTDPLERAIQIAAAYGKNAQSYKDTVAQIESTIDNCNGEDPLYMFFRLMKLLLDRREGEPVKYAGLAEKMALHAEFEKDWDKANSYWEITARWYTKGKDKEQERRAKIAAAECYVKHADWILERGVPQNIVATHWLERAVTAMRRIEGMRERTQEIHARLLDHQHKSTSELGTLSHSMDISDIVHAAIKEVKGKPLAEALTTLARIGPLPKVRELRLQAIEHRRDFVLSSLFSRRYIDAVGRVIAKQPEGEEESLQADMWHNASLNHGIHVQGCIEPARQQILMEHHIEYEDFVPFVQDNPFIRQGREQIVLRGLYAGMQGDILVAVHLLIPQIEDSVRYILQQLNVITSDLKDDGIQHEDNLNQSLREDKYSEPLSKVLGANMVFDLRGLLIEPFGANLRNNMAHGLLSSNSFYSTEACYLWWIALRFYAMPHVISSKPEISDELTDAEAEVELTDGEAEPEAE